MHGFIFMILIFLINIPKLISAQHNNDAVFDSRVIQLPYYYFSLNNDTHSKRAVLSLTCKGGPHTAHPSPRVFAKAWKEACASMGGSPTILVPGGRTNLLGPLNFNGPCASTAINLRIMGKIVAPNTIEAWDDFDKNRWIAFSDVNGLTIDDGEIDGRGATWRSVCGVGRSCNKPTILRLHSCSNVVVRGVTLVNSPRGHISINVGANVMIDGVTIVAPRDSPNTDEIDISQSSHVFIHNTGSGTGDDRIAINGGCSHININRHRCGSGHGISIGSLGQNGGHDTVEDVHVKDCTLNGTQNGLRIKTWQGGSGYVKSVSFDNIELENTRNPIVIDQYYCANNICHIGHDVSDVTYNRVHGASATEKAIGLSCSETHACSNVRLVNIHITASVPGTNLSTYCLNVHGTTNEVSPPLSCPVQTTRYEASSTDRGFSWVLLCVCARGFLFLC